MTYRKTWFSSVLWILYTILCVVSLVLLVGSVWTYYFAGIPYGKEFPDAVAAPLAGLSDNILLVIGLVVLPVTVILYCVIRSISKLIGKKCMWKERTVRVWECITVLLALAGGIFLRIMYAGYVISMADNKLFLAEQVVGMEYYDMAVVTAENIMSSSLDRISYLYVLCLQVALSFLGNKIASAVILQIFLQIVGMILAYAVTRKIAGRLPACIVLVYLACSLCCLRMLIYFSPEWLFFMLYMIGMLIIVSYVQSYCANRLRKPAALLGAVAIGAVIGVLAYIDPAATSLIVLIVPVATGRKKRQEITSVYNSAGVSAIVIFIVVITYILVLLGALYLGLYGEKFDLNSLRIWFGYSAGFINLRPYLYDIYLFGLLIVPAAFLVFEFFRNSKEQNYMLWILMCIVVAPTPMAVVGEHQYGLLSLYIWAVLAGLGLQNCIFGGRAQIMQALIEQINSAAEKAEEDEKAVKLEKPDIPGIIDEIEKTVETNEPENNKEPEEVKESGENNKLLETKESKEINESESNKESEETKESVEISIIGGNKESKEIIEPKDNIEPRDNIEPEKAKDPEKDKEQEEAKDPEKDKEQEEAKDPGKDKEQEEAKDLGKDKEQEEAKDPEKDKEQEEAKNSGKDKEQEEIKDQEIESEEIKVTEETKKAKPEIVAEQRQQKPPRYIDNPLPLPKKHVRKEMDYQYSVEEKDMKFDLEISENDDFDIL